MLKVVNLTLLLILFSRSLGLSHGLRRWVRVGIAGLVFSTPTNPSLAFGPTDVQISIVGYKQVDLCNGQKPIMPGQKAAQGLFPVCIEVTAETTSPAKEELKDVGVYGFVKEDAAGNSVLPNNPDFKSDSGQYAMIQRVPPGEAEVTFQFVAAVSADPKSEPIPSLTFFKTKARAYAGGNKFQPLSECEIDPRSCADEDEE